MPQLVLPNAFVFQALTQTCHVDAILDNSVLTFCKVVVLFSGDGRMDVNVKHTC